MSTGKSNQKAMTEASKEFACIEWLHICSQRDRYWVFVHRDVLCGIRQKATSSVVHWWIMCLEALRLCIRWPLAQTVTHWLSAWCSVLTVGLGDWITLWFQVEAQLLPTKDKFCILQHLKITWTLSFHIGSSTLTWSAFLIAWTKDNHILHSYFTASRDGAFCHPLLEISTHWFLLGFQWSGCSDNLSYGVAFSQTFVDEPERAKGLSAGRPLMNLHNNEAGRKVGAKRWVIVVACQLEMCHWWLAAPPAHTGYPSQHASGV